MSPSKPLEPTFVSNVASPDADPIPAPVKSTPQYKVPGWCILPAGFVIPRGKKPVFMRFRAAWTDDPSLGDRVCVAWSLSVNDERLANKRAIAQGAESALAELSKQMIRVIDGELVDWTGMNPVTDLDQFWNKIGSKCRQLVINTYLKTHNLDDVERADFFANCIEVMEGVA